MGNIFLNKVRMEFYDYYDKTRNIGFRGNTENAKTKLCMRWANGDCRFGDKCNFAHGEHELRRLSGSFNQNYRRYYRTCAGNNNTARFSNFEKEQRSLNVYAPAHGPNGWTEYYDPATGDFYYHNHLTNITQWERPVDWPNTRIKTSK